jgi:predicted DNA-binding WGR domain protein
LLYRADAAPPLAQVGTPGKSEVRHFPDALRAEAWAADSVTEKLKSGFVVNEDEGAAQQMRQEGMPREP